MQIHVLETGRLRGNETFMRAQGWRQGLLGRRADVEFPIYSFVLAHEEGLLAIDTGLGARIHVPRWQRRLVPTIVRGPRLMREEMRERGLDPAAVTRVVLTHLDWDHVGGVAQFPAAQVLVHRREYAAATGRTGGVRYQPHTWPPGFAPALYDLDDEPLGPFPRSRAITRGGDVRVVALPGHSAGQVGVVVRTDDATLLFAADHVLRADWFAEDLAAGRDMGLGIFYPKAARETTRRVRRFVDDEGAVLLPSHDSDTPARLLRALATSDAGSTV